MYRKKKLFITLAAALIGFMSPTFAAVNASDSPVGYWKTIDDVTGKPKSIVQIWKTKNNVLMGKVIKIFPKPGEDQSKLCTACEGGKHNKPIVGMVILTGLTFDQAQWDNGEILDPENGKTYSCTVRLSDHGQKLDVHGYIGLPLLGRSQAWKRAARWARCALPTLQLLCHASMLA